MIIQQHPRLPRVSGNAYCAITLLQRAFVCGLVGGKLYFEFAYGQFPLPALNIDTMFNI